MRAFVKMMKTWDKRLAYIDRPDRPVLGGEDPALGAHLPDEGAKGEKAKKGAAGGSGNGESSGDG